METIREVVRYLPRYSKDIEPMAEQVTVRLCRWNTGVCCILTPWACFSATGAEDDERLALSLRGSFDNSEDALQSAQLSAKHWYHPANVEIRDRLERLERFHGSLVASGWLADAIGETTDDLYRIAHGTRRATAKQGTIAKNFTSPRRY